MENNNLDIEQIHEDSELIRDVLKKDPPWITMWGTVVILFFVFSSILLIYLIRYPDVLVGEAYITSETLPIRLAPQKGGKISQILIEENSYAEIGQPLIVFESTANYKDIFRIKKLIDSMRIDEMNLDSLVVISNSLKLGEIREGYNDLLNFYLNYKFLTEKNSHAERIKALEK